jgi:hypothetical protein
MIQRMCRAMCVAEGQDPDELKSMGGAPVALWTLFVPGMTAALGAMREPTAAMMWPRLNHEEREQVKAFRLGERDDCPPYDAYFDWHREDDAGAIWRAMIDEALK